MSKVRGAGDAWAIAEDGKRYWGLFGAAGLLAYDPARGAILMQHRVSWSDHGGTWGIPGGARDEGETALDAAVREAGEEAGVPASAVRCRYTHELDRGGWRYATIVAEVTTAFEPEITDPESEALAWIPLAEVTERLLHPGFAATWPTLAPLLGPEPTVIVDAANVVGSVPNGWWRDRAGAHEKLRDQIALLSDGALPATLFGFAPQHPAGITLVSPNWHLVVEGQARDIGSSDHLTLVRAPRSGDDAIVAEAIKLRENGHPTVVFTSDRALRARCEEAGARVHPAGTLLSFLTTPAAHPEQAPE